MRFDWGERKRLSSIRKRGIDFVDIPAMFEGDIVTVIHDRFDYGEIRYQTLGLLTHRVIMVVHTGSESLIRLISARKANKHEEKTYFSEISD